MMTIGAVLVLAIVGVMLVMQGVRRSRRRRWRRERKERHARIVREWDFLQKAFGPKPKRLRYDAGDGDGAPD